MLKLLTFCLKKKKSIAITPIYEDEESLYYQNKNSGNTINDSWNETETISVDKRIKNMCNRWKIERADAIQLINLVDSQQS